MRFEIVRRDIQKNLDVFSFFGERSMKENRKKKLSALFEAESNEYKICHPDEPDGISNPHNLPNREENSKKARPGQAEDAKFIDGRILSRRIDSILNKTSLLKMVSSSNGSYTEIIGNALGMSTGASRYKLFYPNSDKTDKREIRVSYHNVVLTNIPINIGKAFCITFVRPDKERLFQQENLLHNTIRYRNIDDTECLEYILYHSKLKADFQCHVDDITQSLLYQILKGIQENLTTGAVSQLSNN